MLSMLLHHTINRLHKLKCSLFKVKLHTSTAAIKNLNSCIAWVEKSTHFYAYRDDWLLRLKKCSRLKALQGFKNECRMWFFF